MAIPKTSLICPTTKVGKKLYLFLLSQWQSIESALLHAQLFHVLQQQMTYSICTLLVSGVLIESMSHCIVSYVQMEWTKILPVRVVSVAVECPGVVACEVVSCPKTTKTVIITNAHMAL